MQLSPIPDLSQRRGLVLAAVFVAAFAGCAQAVLSHALVAHGVVDTDDAMRLVMVRGLLAGHGWFDVHVARLDPPHGLQMHWSRLVDGGIAGLILLFRAVMAPGAAERAATLAWPVLWAFPAALAALAAARRLGGTAAVFVGVVFLLMYQPAFVQFRPGRIDHDNVQIAFAAVAFAGTLELGARGWGAAAAGAATGLLLNVGLEALPFAALLGAAVGIRLVLEPALAPAARRYAGALAVTTIVAYLAQTAPTLWLRPFCDEIGSNLVAGLLVASAGLAGLAWLAPRLPSVEVRIVGLAVVGAAALAVYLAIHPSCARGPFGDVDPRLFSIWLNHVDEMQSLPTMLRSHPKTALVFAAGPLAALVCLALALPRAEVRRDPAWIVAAIVLTLAVALTVYALRSASYAMWFAMPVMAAALARIGALGRPPLLVRTAATACLASPLVATVIAARIAAGVIAPEPAGGDLTGPSTCTEAGSFADLAAAPVGLVGGDIDLGPFVLLYTGDDVLAGPYHRAADGILKAHALMSAPPAKAADLTAAWDLAYLAHCAGKTPGVGRSLAAALSRGEVPSWLTPVSDTGRLLVYRVDLPGHGLRGSQP